MESNRTLDRATQPSLWHWPYVALTEIAILELLGALYMLFYAYYIMPFENNAGLDLRDIAQSMSYFAFLAGSILIFLKRKVGIFVSLAGIIHLISFGLFSATQPPFNGLEPPNLVDYLKDLTNPFGIPSLAIGVTLLIIGWKKVKWERLDHRGDKSQFSNKVRSSPARILLFTTLPIVSVMLLYFVFVSDVRAGLRTVSDECSLQNPNVSEIYLGKEPDSGTLYGVATNHITNKIYAAHSGNGTVSVIDGSSDKLIKIIDLNTGKTSLNGVAVNIVTNRIYIVNSGSPSSTVFVIDGESDTVVDSISVGTYAIGITVDTSLNQVYVASNGDNTVSVIDGNTDTKISSIYIPIQPRFVSANSDDHKVYVSGLDGSRIAVINGEALNDWNVTTISLTSQSKSTGGGIVVNPSTNKVYTSASGVPVIDGSSSKILGTIKLKSFNAAFQYAVNPSSNEVYAAISNTQPAKIIVIDGSTDTIKKTIQVGGSLMGIATNIATGNVYVADRYDGNLYVITKTTVCS